MVGSRWSSLFGSDVADSAGDGTGKQQSGARKRLPVFPRSPMTRRLQIEPLEDRTLLSLTLVNNGAPTSTIVVAQTPTVAAAYAAVELQNAIQQITAATVPIKVDNDPSISGVRLLVGESAITHTYGYYNSSFQSQQYTIDFQAIDLVLMGNDKQDVITGYNPSNYNLQNVTLPGYFTDQATGYAVFDFLEHNLGVHWYNPTASGTVYSSQGSTLTVSGADVNRSPSYGMRTIAFPTGYGYDYDAGVSTLWPVGTEEFNAWRSDAYPGEPLQPNIDRDVHLFRHRMRLGGPPNTANHSLYGYWSRFQSAHPEWFYGASNNWQLRYSNSEVIAQVAQDAADYYSGAKTGADLGMPWLALPNTFPIVPNDNGNWSPDDKGGTLGWNDNTSGFFANDSASNYWFNFVNQVVTALHNKAGHENDRVQTLAYWDYAALPTQVTISPFVDVQFCFDANRQVYAEGAYNHEIELVQAWSAQSSQRNLGLWLYPTFPWQVATDRGFNVFPGYYAHSIGDQFTLFGDDYDAGIYYCGWGQEVEAYLSFQLLHDNSQNVDALLNRYFTEMYGPAAVPMQAFYTLVEQTYSDMNNYPPSQGLATNPTPPHQTEIVAWGWLGTSERMAQLESYMTQAVNAAGSNNPYATRVDLFNTGTWQYMQAGRQAYLAKNPPTASVSSPSQDTTYDSSVDIIITANAGDNGAVAQVLFYADNNLLGTDTTAPYSWTWSNAPDGTHVLKAVAIDNDDLATVSSSVSIHVGMPVAVESVTVNDGSAQRSKVSSLTIAFNQTVTLDDGAFEVLKKGGGGLVALLASSLTVNNKTVVTLTFSGSLTEYGSLTDGDYLLTIYSDKVHNSAATTALDGDGDGVAGGDFLFGNAANDNFFRLFGDRDGDRDVDNLDFARFRTTMNKTSGNAAFLSYFDFDGDGDADTLDFARFRTRMGTHLYFIS